MRTLVQLMPLGCAFSMAAPLMGQSPWLAQRPNADLRVEYFLPDFDNVDVGPGTFTAFVTGRYTVFGGPTVIVEVPFTRIEGRFNTVSALGNPFLGAEFGAGSRTTMELGIRLPIGGDDGFGGTFADIDRWGAFGEDILSVNWLASLWQRDESGRFFVRLRGGPVAVLSTSGGRGDLLVSAGGYWGMELQRVRVVAGVNGVGVLSERDLGLGERTLWQGGGMVEVLAGALRAGLHARVPIDEDMTSLLDAVYGVSVSVAW